MRENFTQFLGYGQTLTNTDTDTNNKYLTSYGKSGLVTIVLYGLLGVGNTNDTIRLKLNGTTFDLVTGTQIWLPIQSVTVTGTTSSPINPASNYARNIATGSTSNALNYNSPNPGILVYGYAINKTMF